MTDPNEFVFDIARGDIGVSRYLRNSLEVIRSASDDPRVRKALDEVLAGRMSMRQFGASETFAAIMDRVPQQVWAAHSEMSAEEREKLVQQGNSILDQLRQSPPCADAADSGDHSGVHELPEDDDYFDEHRRDGWLR